MYCTNCGKEIKSNSKFCPFCGNAVNNSGQNEIISEKQREQETNRENRNSNYPNITDSFMEQGNPIRNSQNNFDSKTNKNRAGNLYIKAGIILLILGLACGGGGFLVTGELIDHYQGLSAGVAYYSASGERHVLSSGTIGGNAEAVSYYETMRTVGLVIGIALAVMGVIYILIGISRNSLPVERKRGRVLEVKTILGYATVEFDDGTRRKVNVYPEIVVVEGDYGEFEIKGNHVIGFTKK